MLTAVQYLLLITIVGIFIRLILITAYRSDNNSSVQKKSSVAETVAAMVAYLVGFTFGR
jgi:hypothetical protein